MCLKRHHESVSNKSYFWDTEGTETIKTGKCLDLFRNKTVDSGNIFRISDGGNEFAHVHSLLLKKGLVPWKKLWSCCFTSFRCVLFCPSHTGSVGAWKNLRYANNCLLRTSMLASLSTYNPPKSIGALFPLCIGLWKNVLSSSQGSGRSSVSILRQVTKL